MNNQPVRSYSNVPAHQRGVTLIELMVALVLGLVLSGAALALFMTNRQTYVASENMDRIQEASRIAFELMARDLREADGNPCSNRLIPENRLSGSTTWAWWSDWGAGLRGYNGATAFADDGFGTAATKRVAGTPAVESWTAMPTGSVVKTDQATTNADLDVTTTGTGIAANDILMICDYTHAAIFQASAVGPNKIEHHSGGTPGNATGAFNNSAGIYLQNAVIAKLHPVRWYIGYNGRTDKDGTLLRSLYRTTLDSGADKTPTPSEIVPDVTGMTLEYLMPGGPAYTDTPANWGDVVGIKATLTYEGRDKISTSSSKPKLERTFTNVIAVRSRAE